MTSGGSGSPLSMVFCAEQQPWMQASIGTHIIRATTWVRLFAKKDLKLQRNGGADKEGSHVSLRSEDGALVGKEMIDVHFIACWTIPLRFI